MKILGKPAVCLILILCMIVPSTVYAREGDSGYEIGISSGEAPGKVTFQYQEVCFVSGAPIVFNGTLTIKKSQKQDTISATYTYDLKNVDKNATLKRVFSYNTILTKKDNNQTVEQTSLTGKTVETIKINNDTYTLSSVDFSRSSLVDSKPAINYYAGNLSGRKIYNVTSSSTGTSSPASGTGTITVDTAGKFYGYDQYWGTAEAEEINCVIQSEKKNGNNVSKWGGTADVTVSSSTTKQIKYVENEPNEISFKGGYVQTQYNSSVLEYNSKLPEFDANGAASDNLITAKDSLKIETFPVQTRLPVPNINQLKGHWSEEDVRILYSLEVFQGNDSIFDPAQYMTRADFAKAIVQAAREVPPDPALTTKTSTARNNSTQTTVSPFEDVSTEHVYFSQIESAYKRGLINGKGNNLFGPDDYLTVAEALTVFVRALGLKGLAPDTGAVTSFRDNDQIPAYARNAACVAERIGLIYGDDKGYLNPNEKLSNARAAALLNRFIVYMRDGIKKDYRDKVLNF